MGALDLSPAGLAAAPDPLLLLLAALAIEAAWPAHLRPRALTDGVVRGFARLTAAIERRLNRPARSQSKRLLRGAIVATMVVVLAALIGVAVSALARVPFGWLLLLSVAIASLPLRRARETAAMATASVEDATAARIAGARLAEAFAEDVVAPVFWFILFGLPGLLVQRAALGLAHTLPESSPRFAEFGMAATRLHAALLFVPALLSGLFIAVAAAATPGGHPGDALRAMGSTRNRYRDRGTSWPAAAMAGALAQPVPAQALPGRGEARPPPRWTGNASIILRGGAVADVRRAAYLYSVACVLVAAGIVLVALVRFAL